MGDVTSAIRLVCDNGTTTGPLLLDLVIDGHLVKSILLNKYPPPQPLDPSCITPHYMYSSPDFHPITFDSISPNLTHSTVLKMEGSQGASGLDVVAWKCLCTSIRSASHDLFFALSFLTKRLCTTYVDPAGLYPLLASRFTALDKNPGVFPIGVGETVYHLLGKTVLRVISPDILV